MSLHKDCVRRVIHRQRPMARGSFCIVPPEVRLGPYPTKPTAKWDTAPVSPKGERCIITLAMGLHLYFMVFTLQNRFNCILMAIKVEQMMTSHAMGMGYRISGSIVIIVSTMI